MEDYIRVLNWNLFLFPEEESCNHILDSGIVRTRDNKIQ